MDNLLSQYCSQIGDYARRETRAAELQVAVKAIEGMSKTLDSMRTQEFSSSLEVYNKAVEATLGLAHLKRALKKRIQEEHAQAAKHFNQATDTLGDIRRAAKRTENNGRRKGTSR